MPIRREERDNRELRAGDRIAALGRPGYYKVERDEPLPEHPWSVIRETTNGFDCEWVRFPDGRWVNADGSSLTEKGIAAIDVYEVIR